MTSQARGVKPNDVTDVQVADYLQAHPEFFEQHAALLAKLRIPHLSGSAAAVSLVERQVQVLRERNQSLERKLKELVEVARANDQLAERIHQLTQRLIQARDLRATVTAVEASMREDFQAMHAVLVLFLEDARPLEADLGRFLRVASPDAPDMRGFEPLLQSGKPRCGQIRDSQRDYLFGAGSVEIGSVALTPLGPRGELGLLAIGASDADRFHPGMSTEFLSRIGELVTYAVARG